MIINDPIEDFARIQRVVRAGYLVRTRADANTFEARVNDLDDASKPLPAAPTIGTDYYLPATHFGNDYRVVIEGGSLQSGTAVKPCGSRIASSVCLPVCQQN